ncbi:type 4b pilus protein PilO2 [Herbaspirillum rubrisubalbicans]|nr:type 4b pilus protein PilO2 [Herbaspirillum rubrisubalbicans]
MASGDNDVLGEAQPTLEGLMSRFQAIGLLMKLSAVPPLKLQAQQQQWQPGWRSFLFSINAHGMAPADIANMLSRPGVRVEKLVYHGAEWSLEGTIYAK